MKKIGLTGGHGAGKSTIAGMLKNLGATVISADEIGHDIYRQGTPAYDELIANFGRGILEKDGTVNRKKLAGIAFSSPELTVKLDSISHPKILDAIKQKLSELEEAGTELVVLEAAILIEAGWKSMVDEVWLAVAPKEAMVKRAVGLGFTEEDALARLKLQLSNEDKIKHARVVIDTDCDLDELKAKIVWLWQNAFPGE
jgi:dephospho-CoA kinase